MDNKNNDSVIFTIPIEEIDGIKYISMGDNDLLPVDVFMKAYERLTYITEPNGKEEDL